MGSSFVDRVDNSDLLTFLIVLHAVGSGPVISLIQNVSDLSLLTDLGADIYYW